MAEYTKFWMLDAGTYWLHNDSGFTDYPGLYVHILTKMNAAAASGYVFQMSSITPTEMGSTHQFGLRLSTVDTGVSWTWDSSGTINTYAPLGWTATSGTLASTGGVVDSRYNIRGTWVTPESPSSVNSRPHQIITPSTEFTHDEDAYFLDQGSFLTRTVVVHYVLAAHVFKERSYYAGYAASAGVANSDDHNALQYTWEYMRNGSDAILVWYSDADDLELLVDNHGEHEIVRLHNKAQMREFGKWVKLVRASGEIYHVSFDLVRSDDSNSNFRL